MPCPTCDHTMQTISSPEAKIHWCPRCGTLKQDARHMVAMHTPMLVGRVRDLRQEMADRVGFSDWDVKTWHRLGISESIDLPEHRVEPGHG